MRLWQLALPSLFAVFLALIAIRGEVESNDSFSRFWDRALAGRTQITIAVDGSTLWLWAETADKLRSAAQTLASRSGFPEVQ
jgi:hypothetical protein